MWPATVRQFGSGRLRRSQVPRMRQKKPRAEINFSSFRILPEALGNYGKGSETFLRKWQNFGRLKKEITTPFSFSGHHFNPEDEGRSEEHTSEIQSLMRISYAVFCLKKKNKTKKLNT